MTLREHRHLMSPGELNPEERLDRIVELLALAGVTETPAAIKARMDVAGDVRQEDAKG